MLQNRLRKLIHQPEQNESLFHIVKIVISLVVKGKIC